MIADKQDAPAVAAAEAPVDGEKSASLFVPSLFLSVVALLIALANPINLSFTNYPIPTIALNVVGLLLLWAGTLRQNRTWLYAGAGLLLLLILVEVTTQPAVLSAPVAVIWPLRILIMVVVAVSWTLLMQPQAWLGRATVAFLVATLLVLLAWGGPGLGRVFFGWNLPLFVSNFAPIWLAVDSQNRVYATEGNGGLIRVFDGSGSPVGGLRPGISPFPLTPGPGILPNGMEDEIVRSGAGGGPTPAPGGGGEEAMEAAAGGLCGLAVDKDDNLYTISIIGIPPYNVLKFNSDGMIQARYPLARNFLPATGCLAVDDQHIYLISNQRQLFVMGLDGTMIRTITLPFNPIGMVALGDGRVALMDVRSVSVADSNSAAMPTVSEVSAAPDAIFQAIALAPDGNILLTDTANNKILRLNLSDLSVVSEFGSSGDQAGQFRGLSGIAVDKEGRLYVADWSHRVIQRFTGNGAVDTIMWAAFNLEPGQAVPTPG